MEEVAVVVVAVVVAGAATVAFASCQTELGAVTVWVAEGTTALVRRPRWQLDRMGTRGTQADCRAHIPLTAWLQEQMAAGLLLPQQRT